MTREALSYIERNFLIETVLKHPDRAEATRVWNFPYAAIKEALVNAVYLRSYEEREPIEVSAQTRGSLPQCLPETGFGPWCGRNDPA